MIENIVEHLRVKNPVKEACSLQHENVLDVLNCWIWNNETCLFGVAAQFNLANGGIVNFYILNDKTWAFYAFEPAHCGKPIRSIIQMLDYNAAIEFVQRLDQLSLDDFDPKRSYTLRKLFPEQYIAQQVANEMLGIKKPFPHFGS